MKTDYTHITYVVDSSSSMSTVWPATISGLEEFIKGQKLETGKCTFSLINFDTKISTPILFADMTLVSESVADYGMRPGGCTALYDAIGTAITTTGAKLAALPESERPEKVLIVIQTDGEENSSRTFNKSKVHEMIEEQKTKYNWQFMFVGASEESINAATDIGIAAASAAIYSVQNTGGYHSMMNNKVSALRSAKSLADVTLATTYSSVDRQELTK
jgi:hypothetical protein